jgi:hypothetical protein
LAEATDLKPLEWLERLGKKLVKRQDAVAYWRRYYDGDHDLPAGPNQHKEAFRRFQAMARTNLCRLCVESSVHRTVAIGFRDRKWTGSAETDPVWQLWQRMKLDARQFGLWRKAYARSAAYAIVGVDPRRSGSGRVTIEGPENVIVECDPADASRRLAALRLWHDEIAKRWMATLYLRGATETAAGTRYHWQSKRQSKSARGGVSWKPDAWEERVEPGKTLPGVPVIPFLNGDEGEEPVAEHDAGIDDQNRLNLTLLNRLSSERYAAFRQTLLLNYTIEVDPVTGEKIAPYKPGVTQIGTIPPPEAGDPEVKVIQLAQTATSDMLRGVESDMRAFAAVTLTPVYYLPGDMNNLGAEAVAALDAGHNAKVRQRMAMWGEGLEELLQYVALATELKDDAGKSRDLSESEIVWARPENFVPSQVGDYLVKMKDAGVPLPMAVEEVGWSPQRVAQLRSERAAEMALLSLAAPVAQPAAPAKPVPPATFQAPGEQAEQ